jgi:hypothetical protein
MVVHPKIHIVINDDPSECERDRSRNISMGSANNKAKLSLTIELQQAVNDTAVPFCSLDRENIEERYQDHDFKKDEDRQDENSYWMSSHFREVYNLIDPCCLSTNSLCSYFSTPKHETPQNSRISREIRHDSGWDLLYKKSQTQFPKIETQISDGKPFEFIMAIEHSEEVEVIVIFENPYQDVPLTPDTSEIQENSILDSTCESFLSLCSGGGVTGFNQAQLLEQDEFTYDTSFQNHQSTNAIPAGISDSCSLLHEAKTVREAQDAFKKLYMNPIYAIQLSVTPLNTRNSHLHFLNSFCKDETTQFSITCDNKSSAFPRSKTRKKIVKAMMTPSLHSIPRKAQKELYEVKRASSRRRTYRRPCLESKYVKKLQPLSWMPRMQNAEFAYLNYSISENKQSVTIAFIMKAYNSSPMVIQINTENLNSLNAMKFREQDAERGTSLSVNLQQLSYETKCFPSEVSVCSLGKSGKTIILFPSKDRDNPEAFEGLMFIVSFVSHAFDCKLHSENMLPAANVSTLSPDSRSLLPISILYDNNCSTQNFHFYYDKTDISSNLVLSSISLSENLLPIEASRSTSTIEGFLLGTISPKTFMQPFMVQLTIKPIESGMKHESNLFQINFRNSMGKCENDCHNRIENNSVSLRNLIRENYFHWF